MNTFISLKHITCSITFIIGARILITSFSLTPITRTGLSSSSWSRRIAFSSPAHTSLCTATPGTPGSPLSINLKIQILNKLIPNIKYQILAFVLNFPAIFSSRSINDCTFTVGGSIRSRYVHSTTEQKS